ncbi:MAG: hypothetical protein ACKVTZ_18225 [Bacteroidia bacterium]
MLQKTSYFLLLTALITLCMPIFGQSSQTLIVCGTCTILSKPNIPQATTFDWTLPSGSLVMNTPSINACQSGTYVCKAYSIFMVPIYDTTHLVLIPTSAPVSNINIQPTCLYAGDSMRVKINMSGGTSPYSYSWETPSGFITNTIDSLTYSQLGSYDIWVTDSNGCKVHDTLWVNSCLNINAGNNFTACPNAQSYQLNGMASGAYPPFSYSWSSAQGATFSNPLIANPFLNVSSINIADTLLFTVTDNNGHSKTDSLFVGTHTPFSVTLSDSVVCSGTWVDLTINSSNPNSLYLVSNWNIMGNAQVGVAYPNNLQGIGTTQVAVSSVNGCTITKAIIVYDCNTNLPDQIFCGNGPHTLCEAGIFPPTTTFNWTYNGAPVGANSNCYTITGNNPGTYCVTATDPMFGSSTSCGLIQITPQPTISLNLPTDTVCYVQGAASVNLSLNPTTIPFSVVFGDGTPSITTLSPLLAHTYSQTGDFLLKVQPVGTSPNCATDTLVHVWICSPTSLITGKVYIDDNNDGLYNIGETGIPNHLVQISPQGYAVSDANGDYSLAVDTLTAYQISPNPYNGQALFPANVMMSFPNSGMTFTHNVGLPPVLNLSVMLSPSLQFIPGQTGVYILHYENGNTPASNVVLQLNYNANVLQFSQATLTPSNATSGSLIWNLGNLAGMQTGMIYVSFMVDTTAQMGTNLTAQASITPIVNDINPANNQITITSLVMSSFDPNDKWVSKPVIYDNQNVGLFRPDLTYRIRFQNTGTAPAFNIVIRYP